MKKEAYQLDQFDETLFRMAEQEKMTVPETVGERVNDILVSLPKQHRIWKMDWKKSVVLAAALTAMFSITATAAVNALRQRMEEMNAQEIEEYFQGIYQNQIGMDNYNRSYTDTEKKRREELDVSYQEEALFPKGALSMISDPEEYKGKGVAFYADTATFFLPEREMTDEELLQIIDFLCKRDYSLQVVNEKIAAGEMEYPAEEMMKAAEKEIEATDDSILQSDAVWNPAQELTIPYTGDLEIRDIAAGRNCIFLMGWNAIHKMEIGSSDSELFFDDFEAETDITALYQDQKGDVYIALMEHVKDGADEADAVMAGRKYKNALWVLSPEGELKRKIDLSGHDNADSDANGNSNGNANSNGNSNRNGGNGFGLIKRMVVDEQGYIYLRTMGSGILLTVLDQDGNYVKDIVSNLDSIYMPHPMAGLGIGKDGKVYTQIEAAAEEGGDWHMGIASVDLEGGCLEELYLDIVPGDTIMLDIISPGADTDFVFWGYDGIFTYNLGEESAVNILPAYEAPGVWGEGCRYCALPDGRLVFVQCTEYRKEYLTEDHDETNARIHRIPEKTCFYYKSGLRTR